MADDGTVSEANKVKYSTVKTKLSDPVKTLADAINTALETHFDNCPVATATNLTLLASHYGQVIEASGATTTLTLSDANTLTAGWWCEVRNTGAANVTITGATTSDTFNGTAFTSSTYSLKVGEAFKIVVNAAATGFITTSIALKENLILSGTVTMSSKSMYWAKGADIASATSITLGTDGNYFDITGSTGPLATINCPAGMLFMLQFDSTPLLTHHATNLNLPFNGLDRQVAAGDKIIGFSTAANQVDVISYIKADGKALIGPLTSGTLTATTSGTSHDVTTIPAWVKRITIMFDRVSTNGTSIPLIQIGNSGGIEAANYNNVSGYAQNGIVPSVAAVGTTGFAIGSAVNDAAHQIVGIATLSLMDSSTNLWAFAFTGGDWNTPRILFGSGTKALSATLTQLRLTTVNGTDAFDNGSFNIMYE